MELFSEKREGSFKSAEGSSWESFKLSIFYLHFLNQLLIFTPENASEVPLEQHIHCSLLAHTCLPIQLSFPSALTETFSWTQSSYYLRTYGLWMLCMDITALSILSGYQHNFFPASLALFVHGYKCR